MLVNIANMDIKKKLTRLYNLEKLHSVARERIVLLEKENRQLKLRIKELEDQNKDRDTKLEAVSFQLEQIKIKLFVSGCFNKMTEMTASMPMKGKIPNLKSCTLCLAHESKAAK